MLARAVAHRGRGATGRVSSRVYIGRVPEPTAHPTGARAGWRLRAARLGAVVLTSMLLMLPASVPASALGEDGPFALPVSTDQISMLPSATTTVPLSSLIQEDAASELDLSSALFAIPDSLSRPERESITLSTDSRTLTVDGEGTWALRGTDMVFTPQGDVVAPQMPVALTIAGHHEYRSEPAVFTPTALDLTRVTAHAASGEEATIPLDADVPEGGSLRLGLEGLTAGSSVVSDGSRLFVPQQGVWQLSSDRTQLTYDPATPPLDYQVNPVRFSVADADGTVVEAGQVSLTVPIIADSYWSAPFGQDIVFSIGERQQFVDLSTLRLDPPEGERETRASADGTQVTVPGQGIWRLDRERGTVRFSPESEDVRLTAPMMVTGTDENGNEAREGLLSTAYPELLDRTQAAQPGSPIVFDLSIRQQNVNIESLQLTAGDGEAAISADGLTAQVPEEGTWTLDLAARTLTFTPTDSFTGTSTPVVMRGEGLYADNDAEATATAVVSPTVPVLRDDSARTAPQTPTSIDVLANDTAGSASQPLQPEDVTIGSLQATNLSELEDGRGKRLVIPGEGTYTVSGNGAISFEPAEGFTGTTTPIDYYAADSAGVSGSASLTVTVDKNAAPSSSGSSETSGINSLLAGLLPDEKETAIIFGTIVMLLLAAGGASLAIGIRMDAERRDGGD